MDIKGLKRMINFVWSVCCSGIKSSTHRILSPSRNFCVSHFSECVCTEMCALKSKGAWYRKAEGRALSFCLSVCQSVCLSVCISLPLLLLTLSLCTCFCVCVSSLSPLFRTGQSPVFFLYFVLVLFTPMLLLLKLPYPGRKAPTHMG